MSTHVCEADEERFKYWRDDVYIHRFLICEICNSELREKMSITALTSPEGIKRPEVDWVREK